MSQPISHGILSPRQSLGGESQVGLGQGVLNPMNMMRKLIKKDLSNNLIMLTVSIRKNSET